jgi:hypothetical protein
MTSIWLVLLLGCEAPTEAPIHLPVSAPPPPPLAYDIPVIAPSVVTTLRQRDWPRLDAIGDINADGTPELGLIRFAVEQLDNLPPAALLVLRGVVYLDGRPTLAIGDGEPRFRMGHDDANLREATARGPVDVDGDGVNDVVTRELVFSDCEMACDWTWREQPEDTFRLQGVPSPEDTAAIEPELDSGAVCSRTCDTSGARFRIAFGGRDEVATWDTDGVVHEHLVADVNGDGRDDLVLRRGQRLAWAAADGASFQAEPVPFASLVGLFGERLREGHVSRQLDAAGDVNGDGAVDLMVRPNNDPWNLAVLPGGTAGPGDTPLWQLIDLGGFDVYAERVSRLGDVNGDGYDDVGVWPHRYGGSIVYGAQGGSFHLSELSLQQPPTPAGDVDQDGFDDVLSAGAIYRGSAAGLKPYPRWQLGESAVAFAVGDVDRDGHDDLAGVVGDDSRPLAGAVPWGVAVWHGQPTGDDTDGDGSSDTTDCAPDDPAVGPTLTEIGGNDLDEDCDGLWSCGLDGDGDGWVGASGVSQPFPCAATPIWVDCDDADPAIRPGATEVGGNDVDEDCDQRLLCKLDRDRDGWADVAYRLTLATACPTDFVGYGDCEDGNADISPGEPDDPTGWADANCDGIYQCGDDLDGDGFAGLPTRPSTVPCASPARDCDDLNPAVKPHIEDVPGDDVDQNCDGRFACLVDLDGDGWSTVADDLPMPCSAAPPPSPEGDCDDDRANVHPGRPEIAGNRWDDDCDGLWAQYQDLDGDGFGAAVHQRRNGWGVTFGGDCDDTNRDIGPGLPDARGDAIDGDCDGVDPFHVAAVGPRSLIVRGVPARARWWLAASRTGGGPCAPVAPGLCVDLIAPALIGSGVGGRDVTVTIPRGVSGQVQAIARVDGAVWRTAVVAVP